MPAKRVRIGAAEAALPLAFGVVQFGLTFLVVWRYVPWLWGVGLWLAAQAALVAFWWWRARGWRASLRPGEWVSVEGPRWMPGGRAFAISAAAMMLVLFVVLVIATIDIALGNG